MKPKRGESPNAFLQRVMTELLDTFPAVVIVAKQENGGALIAAGGASAAKDRAEREAEGTAECEELIAAAPGIIHFWAESRGLVPLSEEEVH